MGSKSGFTTLLVSLFRTVELLAAISPKMRSSRITMAPTNREKKYGRNTDINSVAKIVAIILQLKTANLESPG